MVVRCLCFDYNTLIGQLWRVQLTGKNRIFGDYNNHHQFSGPTPSKGPGNTPPRHPTDPLRVTYGDQNAGRQEVGAAFLVELSMPQSLQPHFTSSAIGHLPPYLHPSITNPSPTHPPINTGGNKKRKATS